MKNKDKTDVNWHHFRNMANLDLSTVALATGIKKSDLEAAEHKYITGWSSVFQLKTEDKYKLLRLYEEAITRQIYHLRQKADEMQHNLTKLNTCRKHLKKERTDLGYMKEIRLKPDIYWQDKKDLLLIKIALIVDGSIDVVEENKDYQYALGSSNQWKASFEDNTLVIAGQASDSKMEALKNFLIEFVWMEP